MKHRLAASALALVLCLTAGGAATPVGAKPHRRQAKTKVFEACKRGCRFRTIQRAVNAAGGYKHEGRNAKTKVVVAVRPGRYGEGVVVDGRRERKDFDGLTIEGIGMNPRATILEGRKAHRENGIEAIGVEGLVLRDLWARDYRSNGFFVHASDRAGIDCAGYRMEDLIASENGAHGLDAERCRGGKMLDSAGYRHGDSAFYVGETPCDGRVWTNHGAAPRPCQRDPQVTLLKDDRAYANVLGYSGTNSRYVKIVESAFYDNGAGVMLSTLDGKGREPSGWNVLERNAVFWNNYDYFLSGSRLHPVSPGLGQLAGVTLDYPTGVGIALYGGAGNMVRDNDVFGNYKWGIASFSAPGEAANEGDDAKNIDNQFIENTMGREGADPNGEYDFWNDGSGGGNCWGGNSPGATFAPGNGQVPLKSIYPDCPQSEVNADQVPSLDLAAGLQLNPADERDPRTLLGYATTNPPQDQECSWVRRGSQHPAFQGFRPVEVTPQPGEVACR